MNIKFNWKRYRKLIPAIVGVGLLITMKHYGVTIPGLDAQLIDWLVSAATVFGVYQAKNEA